MTSLTARPPPSPLSKQTLPLFAAKKRSRVRNAFSQHDPQCTGQVPPYMLRTILRSAGLDLPEEMIARFKLHGRFHWVAFCQTLEKDLAVFLASCPRDLMPRMDGKLIYCARRHHISPQSANVLDARRDSPPAHELQLSLHARTSRVTTLHRPFS